MAKSRSKDSIHQRLMEVLFGDDSDKMTTKWTQWPDPYKSIYSRMLSKNRMVVDSDEYRKLKKLETKVHKFIAVCFKGIA